MNEEQISTMTEEEIEEATASGKLISTYCGSMTEEMLEGHVLDCEVCRGDFMEYYHPDDEESEEDNDEETE